MPKPARHDQIWEGWITEIPSQTLGFFGWWQRSLLSTEETWGGLTTFISILRKGSDPKPACWLKSCLQNTPGGCQSLHDTSGFTDAVTFEGGGFQRHPDGRQMFASAEESWKLSITLMWGKTAELLPLLLHIPHYEGTFLMTALCIFRVFCCLKECFIHFSGEKKVTTVLQLCSWIEIPTT